MQIPKRVAISGAAGRVGYALMFRLAAGGMFGSEQPVSLSLLELPQSFPRLEAREMELRDCAFPLLTELRIGTDPRRMFEGADWVILLGGSTYRPEVRSGLDLLRDNGPVMVDHGRAINHSAPTTKVLVVTDPCNTNCLIAKSHAPDVPADHWFALNRLARMQATAMLAEKARVSVSQVSRVTVWGNSSETAYIDVSNAWIGEHHALEVINDRKWVREVLLPRLAERSRQAMKPGDSSPAGTVAQAILGTIRSILIPTPFERWFNASVVSDGSYGVPRGLIFGFPLITPDGRSWTIAQGHYLDAEASGSTRSECRRARARVRLGFPIARDRLITMLCWIKAARTGADSPSPPQVRPISGSIPRAGAFSVTVPRGSSRATADEE